MMARVISFGDDGEIETDKPQVKYGVRFPTEEEQAAGMTEVPREMRILSNAKN